MTFDRFEESERTIYIKFECYRCKQIAYRTMEECRPDDWDDARKIGHLLCPECKQKFNAFMKPDIFEKTYEEVNHD